MAGLGHCGAARVRGLGVAYPILPTVLLTPGILFRLGIGGFHISDSCFIKSFVK